MSRWTDAQLRQLQRKSGLPTAPGTPAAAPRAPKYGNKKVVHDGITFDSKKELARWLVLQELDQHCKISQLRRQVAFVLAPAVKLEGRTKPSIRYWADFTYFDADGNQVVEDIKSKPTRTLPAYRIKKHLMKSVLNLEIKEI